MYDKSESRRGWRWESELVLVTWCPRGESNSQDPRARRTVSQLAYDPTIFWCVTQVTILAASLEDRGYSPLGLLNRLLTQNLNSGRRWRDRTPRLLNLPWFSRPVAVHSAAPSIIFVIDAKSLSSVNIYYSYLWANVNRCDKKTSTASA